MAMQRRSNKSNSLKARKKRKKRGGFLIFLIVCIILSIIGFTGYTYVQNHLQQRAKRQEELQLQEAKSQSKILHLEINEGDTIATLATKINRIFPKLGLSKEQIITELNNREKIKILQQTYPFIPNSVLNPTIKYPLEGLLAPLTYDYYETDNLDTIIKKPLDAMNLFYQKYAQQLQQKGVSFYDALIHASITNAEVPTPDKKNMAMVSQVFSNRLAKGMGLGSDATLTYALNKKELTQNDFNNNVNNAYNTRSNLGLTPTPIQFVTANAIEAFINPTANNYYYFLTGTCTGREDYQQFFYATSYDEHNVNIKKHMVC